MYSLDDTEGMGMDAPKPIDPELVGTGTFEKLSKEEGAVQPRRESAQKAQDGAGIPISRRMLVMLLIAAALVIALCVVLFVRVLSAPVPGSESQGSVDPASEAARMEAESAIDPGDGVLYNGSVYTLIEKDGAYALVETHVEGDGQEVVVGSLPGKPQGLFEHGGAVLIPENLSDGTWEVSAYTIGAGWSPIADHEGKAVGDKGVISEASLDGNVLRLTVDGSPVEVPLEW